MQAKEVQPKTETRFGKLDYKPKDILMKAETPEEMMRLGSVEKEKQTVQWLERAVRTDDIVYDVGACVGAYSLIAGTLIGDSGKVYAVEPAYPTLATLALNISVNKMAGKVIPLPFAFGDQEGISFFNLSSLRSGAASHGHGQNPQPILQIPIDVMIERYKIPAPCLLKIDVDKTEVGVLKGARAALRNPVLREVLIEVDDNNAAERGAVENEMFNAGFKLKEKHRLVSSLTGGEWNRLYVRREP